MTSQRMVFQRVDGRWANKLRGDERGTTTAATREGAVADARRMLRNGGGGDLTVFAEDGTIASEETVAPERWVDLGSPSGTGELLLRVDGFIALIEERDYDGVLWNTSGARWLERIDPADVPTSALRGAQADVDAAHAALLGGDPALAIEALERVRRSITDGPRDS